MEQEKKQNSEITSAYDPKTVEDKIYAIWEKSGYFNPDKLPKTKSLKPKTFTIIMPPPNANGSLHLGHAVFVALQDIMIRYKRMRGFKTLWLPGADHAGFETQTVYDKKLEKEGRNRFQIPRDELYEEMLEFTLNNKKLMESQLRKLGASCDWSRNKFAIDPDMVKITNETFVKLFKNDLAYRGLRVINWCPKHKTSLSDLEVKYVEREDHLYYIKYKILNNPDYLTVATTRPETMFGDTAIAVNPKDKKYKNLIGKTAVIPLINKEIPIISDNAIDIKFGTGAVKITPAHDLSDFEIWQRHKKEIEGPKIIIDENGRLTNLTNEINEFSGLKTAEARQKIAEALQKIDVLEKIEQNYTHQVSTCYRCGNILEPMPKPQWFIKMKPLAEKALSAVNKGQIKFYPASSKKVFFHWLKNIRDWNISRQIVWAIRIPAWYCDNFKFQNSNFEIDSKFNPEYSGQNSKFHCQSIITDGTPPTKCPSCGSQNFTQDPDVFDTWFSSGQWPYATLGYPNKKDYKNFYPTDVMETGYDILFFWVARMIMLGIYRTKKIPFKTVYLHGLVRDKDRQKMSKSKGNVIDPLGVAELYGTDAVRMALIMGNTPGNDIVISEEKIKGYRNFANKIWNAARFVLQNGKSEVLNSKLKTNHKSQITNHKQTPKLMKKDKQTLKELNKLVKEITKLMDNFKFYLAAEKIYHYFWHAFADKIIEESKSRLQSENKTEREAAQFLLMQNLTVLLKLLHPFMPFITEEIWSKIPQTCLLDRQACLPSRQENKKLLIIEEWPK